MREQPNIGRAEMEILQYKRQQDAVQSVQEAATGQVYVNGAVNKPGTVSFARNGRLTILEALMRAGGLARTANPNKIQVTRPGATERTFRFEQLKKEDPATAMRLQSGDIVEVFDKIF